MTFKQIFTAASLMMFLAITACKTGPKDALARKWKAVDASGPMITPEVKKFLAGEQNTLEFTKDGSYKAWSKGKEDDHGTYTLSGDGKTITTKSDKSGRGETIVVKEISSDKLIGEMQNITITFEPSK